MTFVKVEIQGKILSKNYWSFWMAEFECNVRCLRVYEARDLVLKGFERIRQRFWFSFRC